MLQEKKDIRVKFLRDKAMESLSKQALENIHRWMAEISIAAAKVRRLALELKSALILQRSFRCYVARCEAERRRQILREIAVGPLLTRVARGMLGRKIGRRLRRARDEELARLEKIRYSSTFIQSWIRGVFQR